MISRNRYRPFTDDSETSVKLDNNKLALVLCQVRWPNLATFQVDLIQKVRDFGALLEGLPLFSEQEEVSLDFSPEGVMQSSMPVYHWSSVDRASSVSLAPTFVSLSSTQYENFDTFSAQLQSVLLALEHVFDVPLIERVGVRYVNVIDDHEHVDHLDSMVRPEILGFQGLPLNIGEVNLKQSLNQAIFEVGEGLLQTRTGIIPAGEALDPALGQFEVKSWVFDIDSYVEREQLFTPEETLLQAGKLADAAYDFFKFVIGKGFIDKLGGTI